MIFLKQDDWNIVNQIFIAMSASTQRILVCKKSIIAPVNYKDVLKIDGTLARLSNANFGICATPGRSAGGLPVGGLGGFELGPAARAAWAARRRAAL